MGLAVFATPKKFDHDDKEMVLRQGYNHIQNKFWIQITDRKTGITLRKWMDEEYYKNFHGMGNFTLRNSS